MSLKRLLAAVTTVFVAVTSTAVSAVDYGTEYKNKPTGTYEVKFTDVQKNYWAFEYIGEMQKRGIINGYPDGRYYPENYVERCEFAKIMVGAAGLRTDLTSGEYFKDVKKDDWFYAYVETAKEYLTGYKINGYDYYKPNDYALREDIAVALVKLKGYDTKSADQAMLKTMFSDYESISEAARPYVATAVERGLVSGYEDRTFRGQDSINRAEAAAMLWRAYQYGSDNKTADISDSTPKLNEDKYVSGKTDENENKTDDGDKITKSDDKKSENTKTDTKTDTKKNDNNKLTESKDSGKSYAVVTLAKATINDSITDMTIDDSDNLYYINRKDNSLYKVAVKSGASAKKLTSLSKLTYTETETREETRTVKKKVEKALAESDDKDDVNDEVDINDEDENLGEEDKDNSDDINDKDSEKPKEPEYEHIEEEETVEVEVPIAKYSDFNAQQVYYEPTTDKVWLVGYFNNKTNEQGQDGTGQFWTILNADNLKERILSMRFSYPIIGTLPNEQVVVMSSESFWEKNLYLKNKDAWEQYPEPFYMHRGYILAVTQKNNALYILEIIQNHHGDITGNDIGIYDFRTKSSSNISTEFEISGDKLASGNNSFYFWNIESGKITAFDIKKEKFRTLDIDTINGVDLEDGGYISTGDFPLMRVTSKENFVFADKDAAAIRLLYKK